MCNVLKTRALYGFVMILQAFGFQSVAGNENYV